MKIINSVLTKELFFISYIIQAKVKYFEKKINNSFRFYTTQDPVELDEIYRIRYQVYCEEYQYLKASYYPDKKEKDNYDDSSIHLIIRHKSGDLAATARLIFDSSNGFPIEHHFDLTLKIPQESRPATAEISRFIVARKYRGKKLLLVLIKGLYILINDKGIKDVFAILDDKLLPKLQKIGLPIKKIGKSILFQGLTAPYLIHLNELEEVLYEKNRILLNFLTNGSFHKIGKNYKFTPH